MYKFVLKSLSLEQPRRKNLSKGTMKLSLLAIFLVAIIAAIAVLPVHAQRRGSSITSRIRTAARNPSVRNRVTNRRRTKRPKQGEQCDPADEECCDPAQENCDEVSAGNKLYPGLTAVVLLIPALYGGAI
jgi:hypothetical protein